MMGPDDFECHLVTGLVREEHRDLYQHSAVFHAAVDQLARMLPVWVDGLAALAVQEDANTEAAVAKLERAGLGASIPRPHLPLTGLLFPPGSVPR
jgi:hypothetical protein